MGSVLGSAGIAALMTSQISASRGSPPSGVTSWVAWSAAVGWAGCGPRSVTR
jgi:hypothetical protein